VVRYGPIAILMVYEDLPLSFFSLSIENVITCNLASPFVGVPAALCRMICGDWL
jgi:hypothetical protein